TQQATPLPAPTSGSGTTLPGLSGGTSTATTSTEPWITQAPEASTSSGQIPLINGTSQVTGNFTALPGDPQSIVNSSLMSTSMSTVTSVLADGSTTTEVIPVPVPVPTGKGGGGGGSGEGSGGCSDPGCANGGGGSSGSGGGGNGGTGAGSGSGGGGGTSGGGGGGTGAGSGGEGGSGTSGGGGGGEGKGSGGSGSGGEGEGEGDPDDNKPSETASPTSSATSSSSESCTSTVTATYKSVFCTVTTSSTTITTGTAEATAPVARRDKDCSTLAYSTIMKCSATATTATSSITATATAYANILCSGDTCGGGDCSLQDNPNDGGLVEVRDAWVNFNPQSAPRRTSEPAEGKWAEPANYRNQDWAIFMRGEVAQCHSAETAVKLDPRGTASYAIRWEGNVDSMALEGLKGCAAVIVASRRGAVMFHLWESPVFTRVNPETRQVEPRQEEDWTNYVTHGLRYWDTQPPLVSMAGILNLRTDSDQYQENYNLEDMEDMLNNDANPQVYVVNTIEAQLVTDDNIIYAQQEKYPELVGRLIEEIQVMFAGGNAYPGGIPVLGLKYIVPAQGWDVNYATARGKVLLQYQPAADCQGQASWRLWHDGRWIHSDSWSSLGPHQIYTPYNALEARGQCPFKTVSGSNKTSTVFTNSSTTAPTSWTSSAANSSFTPTWGPAFNTSSVANATLGQTITSLMTTTGLPWMNITVGPTISPTPQAGNSSSSSNLLHRITDVSTLTANISSLTSTAALWSNTSSTSMPVLNSTSMPVLNSTSSTLMPTPTSTSTSSSSTTSSTPITSVATITWSWTVNSTTTVTSTASQAPKYARGTCRAHVKQSVAIQIDHDKKTFFATGFQVEVDIFDNAGNKITSGSSSSSSFTPSMEHPTEWFAWEQDVVIPRGKLDYEVILTMMPHAITVT
ncbi:hypothetical protein V8F33_008536, partial [Rhypophila sp. PSN 637]